MQKLTSIYSSAFMNVCTLATLFTFHIKFIYRNILQIILHQIHIAEKIRDDDYVLAYFLFF